MPPAPAPSPERFMHMRSHRRWTYTLVTLVVAGLLIVLDRSGGLLVSDDDVARYNGRWFTVVRVIDGDTLDIDAPDGDEPTTRVRLWGVDTPEMPHGDPPKPAEPYAEEATGFTRKMVEGKQVHLTLESQRLRGHFGRLLAFVELPDGRMLNESLLSAGLARADDRWSHRHLDEFLAIEKQARQNKLGLWAGADNTDNQVNPSP